MGVINKFGFGVLGSFGFGGFGAWGFWVFWGVGVLGVLGCWGVGVFGCSGVGASGGESTSGIFRGVFRRMVQLEGTWSGVVKGLGFRVSGLGFGVPRVQSPCLQFKVPFWMDSL